MIATRILSLKNGLPSMEFFRTFIQKRSLSSRDRLFESKVAPISLDLANELQLSRPQN